MISVNARSLKCRSLRVCVLTLSLLLWFISVKIIIELNHGPSPNENIFNVCKSPPTLVIANLKKESLCVLKFSLLTIEILLPIIYITKIKHVKNILLYKILYSNFLNIFSP